VQLLPFPAVRPASDLAARIPSLPYDVLDTAEARVLAAGDPYSFLHVVKPEIDLPDDVPHDDPRVYAGGRAAFDAMLARGWMVPDPAPALYVYRLTRQGRTQTGVVGLVRVDDYEEGRIRRHELTRAAKELDRVRHTRALGAHPGLVFLACRPAPALASALAAVADHGRPRLRLRRRRRRASHRVGGARRRSSRRRGRRAVRHRCLLHRGRAPPGGGVRTGGPRGPHGRRAAFVAAVFPGDELTLLDYNRLVRDLGGTSPEAFLDAVADAGFRVTPSHAPVRPERPGVFGMFLGEALVPSRSRKAAGAGGRSRRRPRRLRPLRSPPAPVLGIADVRTDPRIDFVGGGRGVDELARRVRSDEAAVAFSLCPTRLDDVFRVADAGGVMPRRARGSSPSSAPVSSCTCSSRARRGPFSSLPRRCPSPYN
jgi:uncharacterized protein (DUF1015 family)